MEDSREPDSSLPSDGAPPYTDTASILARIDVQGRPRNIGSEDHALEDNYRTMMRQLDAFLRDAKRYEKQLKLTFAAQQKMSDSLKDLAKQYPMLADAVFPDGDSKSKETKECSWWNDRLDNAYICEFHETIVQYCEHWRTEVSRRVKRGRNETRRCVARLTHYHKKVDGLAKRKQHNTEKLNRNLRKLQIAWDAHDLHTTRLMYTMKEVTERGWKEVYVLLKAILQLEWETAMVKFDQMGLRTPAMEQSLDAVYERACQQVTPVRVDFVEETVQSMSSSSDDDEEEEEIEVILAPKNHYRKATLHELSTSPKGIADIEHL